MLGARLRLSTLTTVFFVAPPVGNTHTHLHIRFDQPNQPPPPKVTRLQAMVPHEDGKKAVATDEAEAARAQDVERQLETSKKLMKDLEATWEEKLAKAEEVGRRSVVIFTPPCWPHTDRAGLTRTVLASHGHSDTLPPPSPYPISK